MRILHLCLACFYIDGYNYQENVLPKISYTLGHAVKIIASTETFIDNKTIGYMKCGKYITDYGVEVVRLPYKSFVFKSLTCKLRFYKNLYDEIISFAPDIIFSHDINYCSITEVAKYVKQHKSTVFLADTHAAFYNSGKTWLSRNILHKLIYKMFITKAMPYIKKYYYVGPAEKVFSMKMYGIDERKMEFLPLGGVIPSIAERKQNRITYRKILNLEEKELLFLHTGKLTEEKKTLELMEAFIGCKTLNARLVIIGSVCDDIKKKFDELLKYDKRINYIGWKDSQYLLSCLCACDLYCQPGSVSATLQNAICCGSAIMAQKVEAYIDIDTGNFLWIENKQDVKDIFQKILSRSIDLEKLKDNSIKCAQKYLDYYKMEEKIREQYHDNITSGSQNGALK